MICNLNITPWPDAATEMLAKLWNEGSTGTQIANALKAAGLGNYTRSAVQGRVHRLGLSRRCAENGHPKEDNGRPKTDNGKPLPDPGDPAKRCQWIEGEPSTDDRCKCLKPTKPGSAYCEEHHKRAYGNPRWRDETYSAEAHA